MWIERLEIGGRSESLARRRSTPSPPPAKLPSCRLQPLSCQPLSCQPQTPANAKKSNMYSYVKTWVLFRLSSNSQPETAFRASGWHTVWTFDRTRSSPGPAPRHDQSHAHDQQSNAAGFRHNRPRDVAVQREQAVASRFGTAGADEIVVVYSPVRIPAASTPCARIAESPGKDFRGAVIRRQIQCVTGRTR